MVPIHSGMVQITGFPHEVSTSRTCYKMVRFCKIDSVTLTTGLEDIRTIVGWRRLGVFGHVARFNSEIPVVSILTKCCAATWWPSSSHHLVTSSLQWHWSFHYWSKDFGSW